MQYIYTNARYESLDILKTDLNDINHYCKKCGQDLDAFNICSNENCKRKELQDELVQLIHDKN